MKDNTILILAGIAVLGVGILAWYQSQNSSSGLTFAQADPQSVAAVENANVSMFQTEQATLQDRINSAADVAKTQITSGAAVDETQITSAANVRMNYDTGNFQTEQVQSQATASTQIAQAQKDAAIATANAASAASQAQSNAYTTVGVNQADMQKSAANTASWTGLIGNVISGLGSIFHFNEPVGSGTYNDNATLNPQPVTGVITQ